MIGPTGDPFGDFTDAFHDQFKNAAPKSPNAKPQSKEKGLPWNAKTIDGKLYLPLDQVIELLKINNVLPAVRRGLERHL